ncbi:hypothetical protein M0R45_012332 [Rubus argutus]|uniref:DNA/RNA-binding protein Alba-like domain-containing protein n=1 Tax=Rubus argutus TaxID=59490 RepID=A0AAW1YFC8_RUBAR
MGRAINKTVTIVELIKRRIVGLHQYTTIGSTDITDTWEPLEEGLLPLETTRHVSMIVITLSKKEVNKSAIGYQPPLPAEMVKASTEIDYEGEEGEEGGEGAGLEGTMVLFLNMMMEAMTAAVADVQQDGAYNEEAPPQGRGRGRGGYRGRGRGGYRSNGPIQAAA